MRRLYNPIFPCSLEIKEDISMDFSILNLEERIEAIPYNLGWGIFNGKIGYWVNDEEKEVIKEKAKDFVEFDGKKSSSNSWYSLNPKELEIEITNICNQKCIHCGNSCESTGYTMDVEKLTEIIGEFRKNGGQRLLLTGGEPLIYPQLKEVLEFCESVNIRNLGLVTNGILINESKSDLISKHFDYINVSIHGHNAEVHDKITQLKGSFEKAVRGIELLRKRDIDIIIYFTVMEDNFDSVPEMFNLVKRLNCSGIRFKSVHLDGRAKEMKNISIEGKKLLTKYIENLSEIIGIKVIGSELYRKEFLKNFGSYKFYGCGALRDLIYIGANGIAYPCNLMLNMPVGDIYKNSLSEIWGSDEVVRLRTNSCSVGKDICNYGCGGLCKASKN